MLQKTRYASIRYITNSFKYPANTRKDIPQPVRPLPVPPAFIGPDDPKFISAMQKYQIDMREYWSNMQQPIQLPNGVIENTEGLVEQVKFIIDDINYTMDIGSGSYTGLAQSDFVNWYIKPISITMKGDSIISTNPFLASDNMILDIYTKLQQELSENNYNYFKKPRFMLTIENGLKGLNSFKGVITSFTINENASVPDKYDFTLGFTGKPSNDDFSQRGQQGYDHDANTSNSKNLSSQSKQNSVSSINTAVKG
jgi:hypothetical protein